MSDKAWSGNIGEWGELYAACKIISTGALAIAERAEPYTVIGLQRLETHGVTQYRLEGNLVTNSSTGTSIPQPKYIDAADKLQHAIQNKPTGSRAFSISAELQTALSGLGFTKISAGSSRTDDINLDVVPPGELKSIKLSGYSIKTEAGASPTLYNMSPGRHLHYTMNSDAAALEALGQALQKGGRGRKLAMTTFAAAHPIITPGTDSHPTIVTSEEFASNLRIIDGDAPGLLAHAVAEFYFFGAHRCSDAVAAVARKNPLKAERGNFYHLKYSRLWSAFALGLPGMKEYTGNSSVQGGIIRVRKDLSIVAVPTDREGDGDLLSNTIFDAPSFNRWLKKQDLKPLTMVTPTQATMILPWQIRWASRNVSAPGSKL
jgi:hypothetical protein